MDRSPEVEAVTQEDGRWPRVFRNFGYMTLGKIAGDLFTFAFFVALSRRFGQEGIGQYSLAMALTGVVLVIAEFGLNALSIKQLSRHPDSFRGFFGGIVLLRVMLCFATLLSFALIVPWLPLSAESKAVLSLIGLYHALLPLADGFAGVFVARERMHWAALLQFSLRLWIAVVGVGIVWSGGGLVQSVSALPIVTFLHVIAGYVAITRSYGHLKWSVSPSFFRRTLQEARPYALSGLLFQVSARVDVMLLGFMLGAAAAGLYNAAFRVVHLLMFAASLASYSVFPLASRLFLRSKDDLRSTYHGMLGVVTLAGLPAAAGLWLVAPGLVLEVYGPSFLGSVQVLRLLAPLFLLSFLKSVMEVFMMSCELQRERTSVQSKVAIVNLASNLLLISWLGIAGAAFAAVICEALLVLLMARRLANVLGPLHLGSRALISAVAAAAFCVPLSLRPALSIFIVIPASVAIYAAVLALFREIRENEGRMILALLKGKSPRLAPDEPGAI